MVEVQDKDFVEYVVKSIVTKPEKVKVERTIDERGVLIELTVDPEDMGKVIGKEGRTAKAIRTLLRVLGAQRNARINLKIMEPEGGKGPRKEVTIPEEEESEKIKSSLMEELGEEEEEEEKKEEE
jgi:predicted RNA-binding protein YlqC (UPF0109 family)